MYVCVLYVAAVKLRLLWVIRAAGQQPSRLLRTVKARLHFWLSTATRHCQFVSIPRLLHCVLYEWV